MVKKPKLFFVYYVEDETLWKDGLWASLNLLEKDFDITRYNLYDDNFPNKDAHEADFLLAWGAFGSPADIFVQNYIKAPTPYKKGLCIAGNAVPPQNIETYDVLFYETDWYKPQIASHKNIVHAFGINSDIFKPIPSSIKLFDYLTVGAFATWKRQTLITTQNGTKMALGQIQKDNMVESIDIIGNLLIGGCGVSGMILPEELVKWYNAAGVVYIPADINGGGERAVLEARACGIEVQVEDDNPKLQELLTIPIWDQSYYAEQLKKGILSCLTNER